MADIFISYARADRDAAKIFADAFVAQGWTVWWDPEIFYGTQYDKVIEDELAQAKCIVVLWSNRSVESRWVRSEASRGLERSALIPIRIEAEAEVPLEFTKIQTAELAGWEGNHENQTYRRLVRDIERIIASRRPPGKTYPTSVESRLAKPSPARRMFVRAGLLAAPTLIIVILAGIATQIHRPTAFDLDLNVSKVSFVSAGEQAAILIDKTVFTGLELHGIEEGTIAGERAELLPETSNAVSQRPGSVARAPLSLPAAIARSQTSGASAMFSSAASGALALGELDRLFLPPGARAEVGVTKDNPPSLSVRIFDQSSRIVLSVHGESNVELVGARIDAPGGKKAAEAATLMLRLTADQSGSLIELVGIEAGLTLHLSPANGDRPVIAMVSNLRVSEIEFQTQSPTGAAVTTVTGAGTIYFPDAPDKAKLDVTAGQYVVLRRPKNFFVRRLTFEPKLDGIHLEAGGIAESLKSGPAGGVQERTLTLFDFIWHQPLSVQLFGLAAWLFPTTLAAYQLLKELRK